jgi:hypothetical protein
LIRAASIDLRKQSVAILEDVIPERQNVKEIERRALDRCGAHR